MVLDFLLFKIGIGLSLGGGSSSAHVLDHRIGLFVGFFWPILIIEAIYNLEPVNNINHVKNQIVGTPLFDIMSGCICL